MIETAARESIAFGPVESFIYPVPAGFVKERASFLGGVSQTSEPVRIDHSEYHAVSGLVLPGTGPYLLRVRTLMSSDGIDGATGGYKNPIWSAWTTVIAAGTADRFHQSLDVPVTQAVQLEFTTTTAAPAAPISTTNPEGLGVHIRVHHWS
ncbi:MAG TPA: hypothetical protein VM487_23795 [Phycisphaerae bacterium]|nr:hypothetical protein [Phycisphaerae bacterium]HUU98767.1 hypothetical protein [Phycisphaerae bacterium]